jgi:phosphoglycolate phosphatase
MHSPEELRAAGADFVALWPQEIVAYLLPDGSCRPGGCDCDTTACAIPTRSAPAVAPAPAAELPGRSANGRDVRSEAVELARERQNRRTAPVAVKAGCGCGCDGKSEKGDPYLSVALAMIAAGPP